MKRDRNINMKKERVIMIASSVFVLTALTLTGVYMRNQEAKSQDDGYTIDFSALENAVDEANLKNVGQEEGQGGISWSSSQTEGADPGLSVSGNAGSKTADAGQHPLQGSMEDDMDYMPLEAGSSQITIQEAPLDQPVEESSAKPEESAQSLEGARETAGDNIEVERSLNYSEADGLVRPVSGDIIMHYNMSGTTYFATLEQYKYNPAVILSAVEGTAVSACAEGRVVNIFTDEEIGNAVTLDLGNGYQATYGQLKDILVTMDSYVNAGDTIGSVATPTKYYCVEGCNVYFKLTKNDTPVNPENLF